jgi:hypothetical protein
MEIAFQRILIMTALPLAACGSAKVADTDAGTTTSMSTTVGDSESGSSTSSSTPETETETDSTEPDPSDSGSGRSFIEEPDPGIPDCDPFAQDCPDGEKCVPWGSTGGHWDAVKCVPVLGDQKPGEPCHYAGTVEATDDCDATSHCWDLDGEGNGICAPFCLGTPDEPYCPDLPGCNDYHCLTSGSGWINLCVTTCDPLAQDCGEGLGCFWASGFQCVFTTEDLPIGAECGFINDCAAGLSCVSAEQVPGCAGDSCCTAFCDVGAVVDPCPQLLPGTSCVLFQDLADPECTDVGMCLAPP